MTPSASVVVDTMVVSALVNAGRDPGTAARYRSVIDGRTVVVSFVTVTEMRFWRHQGGMGRDPTSQPGARPRSAGGRPAR